MQHQGDYNSSTTPYYYPPNPNPNPTTDFHHFQPPPYASATPFTAAYHPQPPPPPSADYYPPYHPTDPIPPTAPPSYPPSNPNNINNLAYDHNNNNINSSYDHHLNFPPPPPQKWILGKMLKLSHASTFQYNPNPDPVHDANYGRSVSDLGGGGDYYVKKNDLGMSSGDGGTCSKSSTCKVFDDDFGKAVPKVDVEEGGVKKFRVKWLAESGGQPTMDDVLCQVGVDGIRILDPSTSRTLRIYPLDTITRCEVYDSSTFAFWSKSTVDIEPRRIRLQSNIYTTNTLLDTVTVATIQVKEMGGRSRPVDTVKVTEQSTEKKKGLGEEMNIIKPPNEEKHQWVPYEAVTKCSGCGGDFRAFNRKHHCRNCGDIFCDKCTHGRIALTSEGKAPQVRGDIKCRCDNVRRSNHNRLRFAQGQSKSAAKRRARHLGRCVKCGNFSHDAACPENQDDEFLKLCFDGPIRCYTERLLHPRGYAHARMISEVDRLTEEAKERNYFIK